jgi:hypothetical protein
MDLLPGHWSSTVTITALFNSCNFFKISFISFHFVYECFACTYATPAWLVPTEVRREHQIPWNWSHGWLWATTWVLRFEPWSSVKEASALDDWAISPSQFLKISIILLMNIVWVSFKERNQKQKAATKMILSETIYLCAREHYPLIQPGTKHKD